MLISSQLQIVINQAASMAQEMKHEFVTIEHLFLALLDSPSIIAIIEGLNGDIELLKTQVEDYLDTKVQKLSRTKIPVPTLALERVLQRAAVHVQSAGKQEITPENVLVALFNEEESMSVFFLKKQGIRRLDVINFFSHNAPGGETPYEQARMQEEVPLTGHKALEAYTNNLNQKALKGELDPVIGRDAEINRLIRILSKRRKNNPVLVGDAGVGKTSVVEGLAQRLVEGDVPAALKNYQIYILDVAALLAGTRYRGDFEERFKMVLKTIIKNKNIILFIDEIHTLIGAGATSGGYMDASNILKPALTSGELKCIGATTFDEYRKHFIASKAFSRRFQKIDINEPQEHEAIVILKGLKKKYEEHYKISYTDGAIETAVSLSSRYIHDRKLPDKAVDVIDEAGAANNVLEPAKRKKVLDIPEIEKIVSEMASIPPQKVSNTDKMVLKNLENNLKLLIYGQDKAVGALADSIKLSRSGLIPKNRPIGSFLFAGPTGVGKTELAKQLAFNLGIEFIRFDMSEYMESHTVSRLIGAPPGYVGFDQGGLLTETVSKTPHAVLLLDEIEKAHPDILNLLLQVMDHGTLTDHNGKKADFQNVVLIMTTNVGARNMEKGTIGFSDEQKLPDPAFDIKKYFSPEFRNRLDSIIYFNKLDKKVLLRVIDKFISELETQLSHKNVTLHVSAEVKNWILEKGYDKKLGARPFYRFIQEHIKKQLVNDILFGKLEFGGEVEVNLKNNRLDFHCREKVKNSEKENHPA